MGKGIDYISGDDRVMGLTKVPSDDERMKIEAMLSCGVQLPFLSVFARNRLLLFKSDAKATGLLALVDVLKGQMEKENKSFLDKARDVIGSG